MDAVEKAIRNAFEKGDPGDRAFREKVYRAVAAALDRTIAANPALTPEAISARRSQLSNAIVRVEQEFMPAVAPSPRADPPPVAAPTPSSDLDRPMEPRVTAPPAKPSAGVLGPLSDDPGFLGGAFPEGPDAPLPGAIARERGEAALADEERVMPPGRRRRRRGFAYAFVAATLIAALGIFIWWSGATGLFMTAAEHDTSVPNPPQDLAEEDFDPDSGEGAPATPPPLSQNDDGERDWITVFSPTDATRVVAPGDAAAEIVEEEEESFIRIRSGPSGSAVLFDVGQGVLEQIAGKKVVFAIAARAEPGKPTQIAVECTFGELGDCGRKRYAVTEERGDFLFDMELPQRAPGAAGSIAITSDVEGGGNAVEIFDIRVDVQ